jgi:tRNA dimethylallyltransferase
LCGIDCHLIGNVSINDSYSVKTYQAECRKLLDKYQAEGKDVIISGGTFLYIKAALYPYDFKEKETVSESKFDGICNEDLFTMLQREDPETAKIIDKDNRRRLVRALQICSSGTKKSDIVSESKKLIYPAKFFNIDISTEDVNASIDARVDRMFDSGLVEEVKELMSKYDASLQAFQAIGYKEIISGIRNNLDLPSIISQIKTDTRQYAKRQRTFLRHQFDNIHSMKADDIFAAISYDFARRARNKLSIASSSLARIENSKAMVIGLGGVGSIVADGLIRLGVTNLVLVDKDVVDASNLNRQILYISSDVGKDKATQAVAHLLDIDPLASIKAFVSEYKDEMIEKDFDIIFDCIDDADSKALICKKAREFHIPSIHATGSGLREDASMFKIGKLNETGEPLAKIFKSCLKKHGISDFENISVVYSFEKPKKKVC